MKKDKQHHVWKSYLREWATNEQIFCLQGDRIYLSALKDAATQRQFYKLQALTSTDVAFIRKFWIEPSQPDVRSLHEDYLKMFSYGPHLRANLPDSAKADQAFIDELDEHIVNGEEDHHARLEENAQPLFAAIRRKDISFYENPRLATDFLHFVCVQYFRTVGMRTRIPLRLKEKMNLDVARCTNVTTHIMATNVTRSLILERRQRPLILLENNTPIPFITSDQPAVNLLAEGNEDRSPAFLSLFYPITPKLGVLLDEPEARTEFGQGPITSVQVNMLNARLASASYRHIFADGRDALLPYQKPKIAEE